tara:strand:- start:105 stop:248 length:144 start_codon:yes stop_codon:yes gene_type:complete
MSMYRGSKMFRGTVDLGKIIKLLNGNNGIIFGKFCILYDNKNFIIHL